MQDFKGNTIEGLEDILGEVIVQVRVASSENDLKQRLVLKFENGASLVVDGGFPANSVLETAESDIATLEGETFRGILCVKRGDGLVLSADTRQDQLFMKFICSEREFETEWKTVTHLNFDVDAEPSVRFRAPQFGYLPPKH